MLIFITVYARAAEGETDPAAVDVWRVGIRSTKVETVRMTKIRRIGTYGPSVTVEARVPQTTATNINIPAAKRYVSVKIFVVFLIAGGVRVQNLNNF